MATTNLAYVSLKNIFSGTRNNSAIDNITSITATSILFEYDSSLTGNDVSGTLIYKNALNATVKVAGIIKGKDVAGGKLQGLALYLTDSPANGDTAYLLQTTSSTITYTGDGVTDIGTNSSGVRTDLNSYAASLPKPTITVDSVTADNTINASEAGGASLTITGSVAGDAAADDTVTLVINNVEYSGTVAAGKTFSISVGTVSNLTSDADLTIDARVSHTTTGLIGYGAVQKTYLVDTTAPTLSSSSPLDNATGVSLVNNQTLTFSENVAAGTGDISIYLSDATLVESFNVATGAGSAGGTVAFNGTTGITLNPNANLVASTGYYVTIASTAVKDTAGNAYAGISSNTALNFTTTAAADVTAPTVASVAAPADATYRTGQNLDFTVTFDEAVTITGTPRLALTIGSTTVYATYQSGSGTTAVVFRYSVQSGELDTDGVAVGALGLNGGTIQDAAGNNATLTLNSVASTAAVRVDAVAPTVSSVSSSTANSTYKAGDTVAVTINFSEAVTVTGTPQLTLETGATDRVVNYTSGSGTSTLTFTYTVQAGDTSSDLDYVGTTSLALNSGTIADAAGNSATLTLATPGAANSLGANKAIVIDTTAPTASFTTPADAATSVAVGGNLVLTFSETVTGSGAGNVLIKKVSDNSTVATLNASAAAIAGSGASTTATLAYTGLANSTAYYVTVASGAFADAVGNSYAGAATTGTAGWDFTTAASDTTAPTASFTTPADAATGIALSGNIVLTFSETVSGSGAGNVLIKKVSDNSTVATLNASAAAISGAGATTTATLAYSGLSNSTAYYVTVASGAFADAAGNSYAGATTTGTVGWDFTTVAAPVQEDPAPAAPPPPAKLDADLNKSSDTGASNNDRVTGDIKPNFDINAGSLLSVGQTARLIDPSGQLVSSTPVTAAEVSAGKVTIPTQSTLDDGTYTYKAQIVDNTGRVIGESLVTIKIETDKDGIMPSVELAANGGDFNKDGKADWEQANVTQLPLLSLADFQKGKDAPQASFGAMMVGKPDLAAPAGVKLSDTAQLVDVKLVSAPTVALPTNVVATSPMFAFTVEAQDGKTLVDSDSAREGLQVQTVISLPKGIKADAFMKFNSASQSWYNYANPSALNGSADGAALRDTNGDGLIDQIVITVTDGGVGDEDGLVNGRVVDPGMLADTGVTVLTSLKDSDGVAADVELMPLNKDFNQDGVPDWDQGGIAQLPLASLDDYLQGKDASLASFGTLMVGRTDAGVPNIGARMDTQGQLEGITLSGPGSSVPVGYRSAAPVIAVKAAPAAGASRLTDVDPAREGLQTQVIQYFATGIKANAYLLFDPNSKSWFDYTDPSAFNGSADGAALVDSNNDGLIDAVVITLTDNGIGDDDATVNGVISLHGMLAWYGV